MFIREPSAVDSFLSGNAAGGSGPSSARIFLRPERDDLLVLRTSSHDRARTAGLVAAAVAASFALGWAGAVSWPQVAELVGFETVAHPAPAPRVAETRPGGKSEGNRKTIAASEAPAFTGSIPKPSALPAVAARPNVAAASQANVSAAAALAMRPALAAPPETRPTTIPGWTVVDVRDGTAVLEGPDGIRMAARGDAVPGLGRIESIVRWGNRWIVATANGLIATQ